MRQKNRLPNVLLIKKHHLPILLMNRKSIVRIMEDFVKNAAVIYLGALLALVIGIVIVLVHNVWVWGWPVIITILGWIAILKGIWLLLFPKMVDDFMQAYLKYEKLRIFHLIFVLLFGALLTYLGFFG